MSISEQNFGFDPRKLAVLGRDIDLFFTIDGIQVDDVASAEWVLVNDAGTALVTKTVGAGITLTDITSGLQLSVELDSADTADLAADDYRHRLEYVRTGGSERESLRGHARLTAPL